MKNEFRFGVVGHRIGYSKSPDIFDAVSNLTGAKCSCTLHDIEPIRFIDEFPGVLQSGIDGFSVTIPFKNDVVPFLDEIDTVARVVGAVNSVAVRDGKVYGFNTDSFGFSVPLEVHGDVLKGGTALVIGAGGAARAVVHALHTICGMGRILVLGRTETRLSHLKQNTDALLPEANVQVLALSDYESIRVQGYDIVVNATPAGGWNHPDENPFPKEFDWLTDKIYYDLSYNDGNKLLEHALSNSMVTYDGSRMLVAQAVRSIYHWSGLEIDADSVYKKVFSR